MYLKHKWHPEQRKFILKHKWHPEQRKYYFKKHKWHPEYRKLLSQTINGIQNIENIYLKAEMAARTGVGLGYGSNYLLALKILSQTLLQLFPTTSNFSPNSRRSIKINRKCILEMKSETMFFVAPPKWSSMTSAWAQATEI